MFALMPFSLTACEHSNEPTRLELPLPNPALQACAAEVVPAIPGDKGTALTREQAANSLAEQRASALSKGRCANDYRAWYLDLRAGLVK